MKGKKPVQEKPALAKCEDDFIAAEIFQRAGCDVNDVARPQCRQHALAVHF